MSKVLVIGASGFVGKHLVRALLAQGHDVRAFARTLERLRNLAAQRCDVMKGDIADPASMQQAVQSMHAVYVLAHTLSPQRTENAVEGFMEIEKRGLANLVAACSDHGVRRLIYVTFIGTAPDAPSAWVRERWAIERSLLESGLDVTIVRPSQIVGAGGRGFDMMVRQAKARVAVVFGNGRSRHRNIAIDDLVYYLAGVLDDPRANGQCYDVGCDDILTTDQMIDLAADVLGRRHPLKLHVAPMLLRAASPLIERMARLPRGAVRGIADSLTMDSVGDPMPIRAILPRPPLSYRASLERALSASP